MANPLVDLPATADEPPVTQTPAERSASQRLLGFFLDLAVPVEIEHVAGWTDEQRFEAGRDFLDKWRGMEAGLTGGAELLHGGKAAATEFAAVARALAVLAYQPGGVTAFGHHWCTDHLACQRAAAEAAARGAAA